MEAQMQNQVERTENIGVEVITPEAASKVAPLNYEAALASYPEQERKEILALADSIDVTKIDNVMSYGAKPLQATFDQCGRFLKNESGSQADQEVIKQVIELSKKASQSYDDFNLVLQEPNLLQKVFIKVMGVGKGSRTEKIQQSAITNYKLLMELQNSCKSWLEMLKKSMAEIDFSATSDIENIALLEKYIIAGKIAEERITGELAKIQSQYQETGLQQYSHSYEQMKQGYELFGLTMANLEKSRVMYHLSLGQLSLIKRSNRNVQVSIHTQVDNSMALIGQQLRNALLNAKTKEVLEGQKAISRLNDELIMDISKTVGITAEQSEKLIYAGFYNTEAAKQAVTAVITSCNAIEKTATEMLPKMKADLTQLEDLIKQLEPCVTRNASGQALKIGQAPTTAGAELKF